MALSVLEGGMPVSALFALGRTNPPRPLSTEPEYNSCAWFSDTFASTCLQHSPNHVQTIKGCPDKPAFALAAVNQSKLHMGYILAI